MTRDTSSLQEAKMLLEVLKRIPLNRKISTTDLHQQLTAAGYELSRRTLQRYLKALSESDMGVQCDDKSKPFGYRRLLNSNDLDRVGLGADGAPCFCLLESTCAIRCRRTSQIRCPIFLMRRRTICIRLRDRHPKNVGSARFAS